jgi:hypothetical protein
MELEDVAAENPEAIGELTRRDVVCLRCGTPLWKTVAEAARDAGYEGDAIEELLAEVNAAVAARR